MTLYEFNQAGYMSLPKMTKREIDVKKDEILKFLNKNTGKYFMLVCNELRYYTLFNTRFSNNSLMLISKPMIDTILEVISELGSLKAIEINKSMIEFWLQDGKECHMYALFNYDRGVIDL